VDQDVEHVRLDRHPDTSAVQLVPIEIELGIAEGEDHTAPNTDVRGLLPVSRDDDDHRGCDTPRAR
jgi:hypothetical protein